MFRIFVLIFLGISCRCANAANYFDMYDSIQKALISQQPNEQTLQNAKEVFPKEVGFHKELTSLVEIVKTAPYNYALINIQSLNLYLDFMRLPATAHVLYGFLENQQLLFESRIGHNPLKDSSLIAWFWSYMAEAALYGYQATGEMRFVDLYLKGANIAMKNTDQARGLHDNFGREHLVGWGLQDGDKRGREITLVGLIVAPMIEFALEVKNDNNLDKRRKEEIMTLGSRGAEILKPYLAGQVIQGSQRYFRYLWNGEHDAMNHMLAFARAAGDAYKLTGDTEFRDTVNGVITYFLAHAKDSPTGAYSWPYQVLPKDGHGEPFWKGAVTVTSLIKLHEGGFLLKSKDLEGIVKSFSEYVIKDDCYSINGYMSNKDFPLTAYNSYLLGSSNGAGLTSFVVLDASPGIRNKIIETVTFRQDLFPRGFLMEANDAVAYAHMLKYPDRQ